MIYSCAFIELSLSDLYIVCIFYVCLSIFVYICLLLVLISNYWLICSFPYTSVNFEVVFIIHLDGNTSARPEVRGTADVGWRSLFPLPIQSSSYSLTTSSSHVSTDRWAVTDMNGKTRTLRCAPFCAV